jgi:hypothetical protein
MWPVDKAPCLGEQLCGAGWGWGGAWRWGAPSPSQVWVRSQRAWGGHLGLSVEGERQPSWCGPEGVHSSALLWLPGRPEGLATGVCELEKDGWWFEQTVVSA